MKSVLFTYYSNQVQDIFLENVESLLKRSEITYDEIAICSQIEVPVKVMNMLTSYSKVSRFFPDHNSQKAKKASSQSRPYQINPLILTFLGYRNCQITVFDPHLFILNEVTVDPGKNLFYKDHTGLLSAKLFTMVNTDATSHTLISLLDGSDFTDISIINKFSFIITNSMAFSPTIVNDSLFIFSGPAESDLIIEDKLIALDLSDSQASSNIHKKMWEIRADHLPKVSTLTRIKKKTSSVISNLVEVLQPMSQFSTNSKLTILFKYTSRSRPDQFYRGLISIINNCTSPNYLILCSLDNNDPTLDRYLHYINELNNSKIKVCLGDSKNKIDAINRDLNSYKKKWDILINMSDDMLFHKRGVDEIIRESFGSNLDQFVHFNDGNQKSNLCSMTIEGKSYYRRFNYIYHPDYVSLWCDVEAQEVAKNLGKYKYMGDEQLIFRHLHPSFGLAQTDAQYAITESQELWSADLRTYTIRKNRNFVDEISISVTDHTPILSILILTIHSRKELFEKLLTELISQSDQFDGGCEILYDLDDGAKTKGQKRNDLLEQASGKYVAFFDDDDWPSADYVSSILSAVESDPDCCSLLGEMTTDSQNPELFEHSLSYIEWKTSQVNKIKYERNPNHLNAIRSTIAKSIKFPEINFGEDHEWSKSLMQSGLLKTESKISNVIYHYRYTTSK